MHLSAASAFPGFAALLPVGGTALLLIGTEDRPTLVRWLLTLPPMRFLGWISYSLYLWHWPLIVFARYIHPLDAARDKLILIALAIIAATASWLLIERPVRRHGRKFNRGTVLAVALGIMLATTLLALVLPALGRRVWPPDPAAERILVASARYDPDPPSRAGTCFIWAETAGATFNRARCLTVERARPNVLIVGDSHSAMLWYGLARRYPGINFLQASVGNCSPLPRHLIGRCAELMNEVVGRFQPAHKLDAIVFSALWHPTDPAALPGLIAKLRPFAGALVIVGPPPQFSLQLPEVAARAVYRRDPGEAARFRDWTGVGLDAQLAAATQRAGARYVSVLSLLCRPNCPMIGPTGLPLLFDGDHLTSDGSLMLARRMPDDLFAPADRAEPPSSSAATNR